MPKNKVSDPITDQEMAFARLVLSGGMTDRQAAEAVGLNPDSAAYTKSKPLVRDYMLEHRAAVQQQLVQQEADGQHRLNLDRERVLARLWEIADLGPEMTRGSITGQVKALSMIVSMQNFIPDRRAISSQKSTPASSSQIHTSVGFRRHEAPTTDPEPTPAPQEEASARPASPGAPDLASGSSEEVPLNPGASQSTVANRFTPSEAPPPTYIPLFNSVPDLGVPLPIKNPFVRPR